MQEAEKQMADNVLAITAAERALQQAKIGRGAVVYWVYVERKAVEKANVAQKCGMRCTQGVPQQGFKAAAREAGLFASKEVARAMIIQYHNRRARRCC